MKIYAIRSESSPDHKDFGYLLYFKGKKRFYIELPEDADPWETPLLLSSFLQRGIKSIDSDGSELWVQQRVVPSDRQNIVHILRDNGLTQYDTYDLLMLSMGRCSQDDYFLVPIIWEEMDAAVKCRFKRRIEDIVPLDHYQLLVFFRDGLTRKCDLSEYFKERIAFRILLRQDALFSHVQMQPGGYGITWDVHLNIPDSVLYTMGQTVPLGIADMHSYINSRVITSSEAANLLDCSRQNIEDLVKRGKLHPIKVTGRTKLFAKSDVLQRIWQ
jgi:excisionase family DNA binding protein